MDIRKAFATSRELEEEGVWVDLGEGARLKIARIGNPANRDLMRRKMKPHRTALRADKLPEDILNRITIEVMAETILLGWEGLTEGGQPLPYTRENAIQQLTELKDFRDQVADLSQDMTLFQEEREAQATGN